MAEKRTGKWALHRAAIIQTKQSPSLSLTFPAHLGRWLRKTVLGRRASEMRVGRPWEDRHGLSKAAEGQHTLVPQEQSG